MSDEYFAISTSGGANVQISCHRDSLLVVFAKDLAWVDCTNRDFLGFQQIVASNSPRPLPVHLTTNGGYTSNLLPLRYFLMEHLEYRNDKENHDFERETLLYS